MSASQRSRRTLALVLLSGLVLTGAAAAQEGPGPVPTGDGTVAGRIVHPDGPDKAAGLPVVLYGLSERGQSGVADTVADETGRFRFEGVSNEAGMTYLVGARYETIPFFGPRVVFEPGATETFAVIEVSDPISDGSGISVAEVIVQLEWVADRIAVQEIHRLRNESGSVVLVGEEARDGAKAPFETRLPAGAGDFVARSMGFEDAIVRDGERVRFWGPLYPDGQDLRFQYTVPLRAGGETTPVELVLPMGTDGLSVIHSAGGPRVEDGGDLGPEEPVTLEGREFLVRRLADVAPGRRVRFAVGLPPTTDDLATLRIERADAWVEYDDTLTSVNLQTNFVVDGGERLASASDEPLIRIPLPPGAEVVELAGRIDAIGGVQTEDAIEIHGPLPPGESPVGIRFRLAPGDTGVDFDLRFPVQVKTLNVLVADTGIAIESDRLHRRRPFRNGTRIYLHREAFHVEPDETIRVGLTPLTPGSIGNRASIGLTLVAVVASALFLAQPLLRARRSEVDPEESSVAIAREAIYQDIRDLDHDFETGKISETDHREMREALRARAVDLLRLERGGEAPEAHALCPECGIAIEKDWTFCSGCGSKLGDAA